MTNPSYFCGKLIILILFFNSMNLMAQVDEQKTILFFMDEEQNRKFNNRDFPKPSYVSLEDSDWVIIKGVDAQMKYSEVLKLYQSRTHQTINEKKTFVKDVSWGRLKLESIFKEKTEYVLIFETKYAYIDAYYKNSLDSLIHVKSGSKLDPVEKDVCLNQGLNAIRITLNPYQETTIWFRFDNRSLQNKFEEKVFSPKCTLYDWPTFQNHLKESNYKDTMFLILFGTFAIYYFILSAFISQSFSQRTLYVLLGTCIICIILSIASQRYLLYHFVSGYLGNYIIRPISFAITYYFLIHFAEIYLNIQKNSLLGYRVILFLKYSLLIVPFYVLMNELLNHYMLYYIQSTLNNLFYWYRTVVLNIGISFILMVISLIFILKGKREATYYFISFALFNLFTLVVWGIIQFYDDKVIQGVFFDKLVVYLDDITLINGVVFLLMFSPAVAAKINSDLEQQIINRTKDLEELNMELKELYKEKNNLIYLIVHESRKYLGVIRLFTSTGLETKKTLNLENIKHIDSSVTKMSEIIDRINKFNNEEKKIELDIQPFNCIQLVQQIIDELEPKMKQKNLILNLSVLPDNLDIIILKTDQQILYLIIKELIDNAIKYSPFGKKIFVTIDNTESYTTIFIQDQGPGVDLEDSQRIFQKYQTGNARPTNNESSTGLGLYFVKKYSKILGAEVGCIHKENHNGALFFMKI